MINVLITLLGYKTLYNTHNTHDCHATRLLCVVVRRVTSYLETNCILIAAIAIRNSSQRARVGGIAIV